MFGFRGTLGYSTEVLTPRQSSRESRSLQREFELLIMVEVRIEEMFRSD